MIRQHFRNTDELVEFYQPALDDPVGYDTLNFFGTSKSKALSAEGVHSLKYGYFAGLDEIEKLRSELWESVPRLQRVWNLSVAGAFPCVPSFLAGEPESMWSVEQEQSDRTPLRVWIGTGASWSIPASNILKRGAALVAFAQALSEIRPVIISAYSSPGDGDPEGKWDCILSWDLQTSPMVLSEVSASLCDANVTRHLTNYARMYFIKERKWNGFWCHGFDDETHMRQVLGCAEEDLWLAPIHIHDPFLENPIQWIHDKLQKYTGNQEEMTIR